MKIATAALALLIVTSCGPRVIRLRVPPGAGDTLEPGSASRCRADRAPAVSFETWSGDALHWRADGPAAFRIVCPERTLEIQVRAAAKARIEAPASIAVGEVAQLAVRLADAEGEPLECPQSMDVDWQLAGEARFESPRCEFPPFCTCGGFFGQRCVRGTARGRARVRASGRGWSATLELTVAGPPASDGPARPPVGRQCPSEEALREIHAAAFHFQHARTAMGREHLTRARALVGPADGAQATELVGKLTEISALLDRDADAAARETEWVRLALGDWACLPPAMHDRFHTALSGPERSIRRVELEAQLADLDALGRTVRATPVPNKGVRLEAIRPGSLLDRLGFQDGDLVRAVNTQDLATSELALHAWMMQRWASTFRVDLQRRGADLRIEIKVIER